jgi:serine/threonine protein kinase
VIGGRYTLDREIGRGGMGAVWQGRDEVLGRPVAIKKVGIQPGGTNPDLMRAEREARLAAKLNHPHVVAVYDLVEEDEQQWLVMEYVEGRNLAELVKEQGALPPDRAAALIVQAADALSAAHAAGIVHRDVKPSNILVTSEGQVKLSDFGIARAEADASLTQTGLVTGSPAYLAPEIASGQQATPASDVWSLGATLFHTLSGRPPYEVGDNVLGAMYRIVNEEPPRLENAGWLAPVVESSMTREPSARWPMGDVADFLRAGPGAQVPGAPTATLRVVPPAPPDEAEEPTEVMHRAPTRRAQRGPSGVLPWLVGAAVVALVVMVGVIIWIASPDSPEPPAADEATTQPDPGETTDDPSDPPAADEADMEEFARTYVDTAASDPASAFALLTPDYQDASGGIVGYEAFWGTVTNPRILAVDADASDPDDLSVTYTYRYNQRGEGSKEETVVLRLVRDGGGYLIAGAA